MKKPTKTPDQGEHTSQASNDSNAAKPTIDVSSNIADNKHIANGPSINPPSDGEALLGAEDAFGAGVWNRSKKVNGLYATQGERNAWMSVVGIGWVKLSVTNNIVNNALTILASAAKIKQSNIDYNIDNSLVTEIYVW